MTQGAGFWKRHFGNKAAPVLGAAAVLGIGLGIGTSLIKADKQPLYPSRSGTLTWIQKDLADPGAQQLLSLGFRAPGTPWSSSAQIKALRCSGVDIQTATLINAASLATQPDGWLSLPGVSIPPPIENARRWLTELAKEPPKILSVCQIHASWHDPEWHELAQSLVEERPQDTNTWNKARNALLLEAQKQRLAQLVLGVGLQGNDQIIQAHEVLERTGQRLVRATGQTWGIGLDGRIALTLLPGDPHDPIAGTSRSRPGGRDEQPVVDILAENKSQVVLHEWFHGLDLVAAPQQTTAAIAGVGWSNQRHWFWWSQGPIERIWKTAETTLDQQHDWVSVRRKTALKERSLYWLDDGEAQAYAFELWAEHDLDKMECNTTRGTQARDGARPTLSEAACVAKAWKRAWSPLYAAINSP